LLRFDEAEGQSVLESSGTAQCTSCVLNRDGVSAHSLVILLEHCVF
jgi:hypothetical protein